MSFLRATMLSILCAHLLTGCDDDDKDSDFRIWSSDFTAGEAMPINTTCEGQPFGAGLSPSLTWSSGPEDTKSYAIVFKDLSLVDSETPDYAYHWMVWNIPTSVTALPAALSNDQWIAEAGGAEQLNGGPNPDLQYQYLGPCPSWPTSCDATIPRTTDTYSFTLYALPEETLTLPEADPEIGNYVRQVGIWLETVAIDKTELIGTSDALPSEFPACEIITGEE